MQPQRLNLSATKPLEVLAVEKALIAAGIMEEAILELASCKIPIESYDVEILMQLLAHIQHHINTTEVPSVYIKGKLVRVRIAKQLHRLGVIFISNPCN